MAMTFEIFKSPSGLLKAVEISFTIISISVCQGSSVTFGDPGKDFFGGGVLISSLIITTVLLVVYILGSTQIQKTFLEIIFNAMLCVLLIAAGSVIIASYQNPNPDGSVGTTAAPGTPDAAYATGSFCIMNALVYGADAFFAYKAYT